MSLPEKIDNSLIGLKKGKHEKAQKRQAHIHNRRKAKAALNKGDEPFSDYGKYNGWTT